MTAHPGTTEGTDPDGCSRAGLGPLILVTVLVTVHAAWMAFQPGGAFAEIVFGDLSSIAAATLAGAACLSAARRVPGRRWRRGWALIGLGMLCWAAGDVIWAWYEIVLRMEVPYVSIADLGYLAMAGFCIAGIISLVSFREGGLRVLLDGLTISAAVLFVSWATVLSPAFGEIDQPALLYVVNLAYPVSDVAMVSMVTLLLMHGGRRQLAPLGLLGLGLVAFAVADSAFAYLAQSGSFASGSWIDTLWITGFLLIALGGRYAGACGKAPHRPESVWPLISFVPLGAATVTSAIVYAVNGRISPFLYILTLAIVVLVVVRQAITLRENVELNRRLTGAVRDLRRRESQLSRLAFHDPLTGLANRSLFRDRTEHACTAAVRDGRAVGVLYIDLDDFKQINDSHGHAVGDEVLIEVGRRLRECLRPEDTMGRLGGDEFAVLLEHVERPADLDELTARLSSALCRPLELDGVQIPLSASIGVALHEPGVRLPGVRQASSGEAEPVSELLRRADLAMYAAKVQGNGRSVTFQHPVQSLQTDPA